MYEILHFDCLGKVLTTRCSDRYRGKRCRSQRISKIAVQFRNNVAEYTGVGPSSRFLPREVGEGDRERSEWWRGRGRAPILTLKACSYAAAEDDVARSH